MNKKLTMDDLAVSNSQLWTPNKSFSTASLNSSNNLGIANVQAQKSNDAELKHQNLQQEIEKYNQSLSENNEKFENVELFKNLVLVKLARLPHIDPVSGLVKQRMLREPSKSGADIPGDMVLDMHPYYPFGYVVKSNSDSVTERCYVQLSPDAVLQVFNKAQGLWKYELQNEFNLWNEEKDTNRLERYILVRDYMVIATFNENYEPFKKTN